MYFLNNLLRIPKISEVVLYTDNLPDKSSFPHLKKKVLIRVPKLLIINRYINIGCEIIRCENIISQLK